MIRESKYPLFRQQARESDPQTMPHFNGPVYEPALDKARLTQQHEAIRDFMADHEWHTLAEIAKATRAPEGSASAPLRHLRKRRFGSHIVTKRRVEEADGLYQYRMDHGDDK